jgi:hypothetical protein
VTHGFQGAFYQRVYECFRFGISSFFLGALGVSFSTPFFRLPVVARRLQ